MLRFIKPKPFKADPLVKALTPKQLEKDVADFEHLLSLESKEQRIHEFLSQHSYFFNGIIRLFGVSPLYSKIRLGNEYEIDFVCFDSGSCGPEWYLIEIEGPNQHLFTKSGDPSKQFSHAIRQVQDWQSWIHNNLDYTRKLFPYIEYPLGYIFLGRRSELTPETAKRLRYINHEYRRSLEIHSLDWFISAARSVTNIVEKDGRGTWGLPMKAYTHKDLHKGLPPDAMEYINSFFHGPFAGKIKYPEEFLLDREWKYSNVDRIDE